MSKNEEWTVTRSARKRKPGGQGTAVQAPVPVIPTGKFAALAADDDEDNEGDQAGAQNARNQRIKERKRRAKAKAAASQEQQPKGQDEEHEPGRSPAPAPAASKQPATAKDRAAEQQSGSGPSLIQRLVAALWAALAWLAALLGLGKKKKPARAPKQTEQAQHVDANARKAAPPAADASAQQQAPPSAAAKESAPAPTTTPKAAANTNTEKKAAEAVTVPPTKAPPPPKSTKPPAVSPSPQVAATQAAAATPLPDPKPSTQQAKQHTQQAKQAQNPRSMLKGVGLQCDPAWVRGVYAVTEQEAHAGVVSSVAVAGQVALTCGHDGSVKVWLPCCQGGRPKLVKHLAGHSGRVEAVCADEASQRAVTSGRDSSLKVWALGTTADTAGSSHLHRSVYVYESIRCMAVDWGASPPVAALGAASGNISLYEPETGRKVGVLKRLASEVSAVHWVPHSAQHSTHSQQQQQQGGLGLLISGSTDGEVVAWDVRQPKEGRIACRLHGARRRVCSLTHSGSLLYVGDYSSTMKVYDTQHILSSPGTTELHPIATIPVAPSSEVFGDVGPVAAVAMDPAACVMLSSGIAWWTNDWEALVEAPEDEGMPTAVLSMQAVSGPSHEYLNTVRLGQGIATCACMLTSSSRALLVGSSTGSLFSVCLCPENSGGSVAQSLPEGTRLCAGLRIGVEEVEESESEDESSDGDD